MLQSVASQQTASGFDAMMEGLKTKIDAQIAAPIVVPLPKDAGGGYTHEQHKSNAKTIYEAGALYTQTGEQRYADFAAKILLEYAQLYPTLDLHPEQKEQSPGRLFWQNLNESWWLVYVIRGYGAIMDALPQDSRDKIENDVLLAISDFLSEGSPETFNKIHNHGTWATAAVGMTGYTLGRQDLVDQALLGLDVSGDYGFLKQLDELFSPDGYYNEGPYYQRYALMPFVLFGQAIEANEPDRKIFEHRDGILKKAIYTTIEQSYAGLFFPINDAIKDKGIATTELQYGVAIAYDLSGDPELLSIARQQGGFVPTPEGRALSRDIDAGLSQPFEYTSMRLRDGRDGDQGALDILRDSSDANSLTLVMKNTSQGLGHGHFDKMGYILYDNGYEIISDYGAARFLNIEAKYGGHYLPENNAFAKQTIAHNALVVDRESHFNADVNIGNQHAPVPGIFNGEGNVKIARASIDTAYDGVTLDRTMAIISDPALERSVVVDLMAAHSDSAHKYELPIYFKGQLIDMNLTMDVNDTVRRPLGRENGYQYLWDAATGAANEGLSQITWLTENRFYTVTSTLPDDGYVQIAEIGANDPNFNLIPQQAAILTAQGQTNLSFVSVIEPHGEYNGTLEFTRASHSQLANVTHISDDQSGLDYIQIETKSGAYIGLALAENTDAEAAHSLDVDGGLKAWQGPFKLFGSDDGQNHTENQQ